MEHKAFLFDYDAFVTELAPVLQDALLSNDAVALADFLDQNLADLRHPMEHHKLDEDWRSELVEVDVQIVADLALTKYYDPREDYGLGEAWDDLWDFLEEFGLQEVMLGRAFGRGERIFCPGTIGSYFQTPEQVTDNLKRLDELYQDNPEIEDELDEIGILFQRAARARRGLYVTF
ncbi:MAG TPA: hypothetical protein VKQ72_12280 [Aggregatilineales bacterium]|nr:hypothetical protein [Aggregatilineales bacterium]